MASLGREAEHEVKALLQVNLLQISDQSSTRKSKCFFGPQEQHKWSSEDLTVVWGLKPQFAVHLCLKIL